MSNFTCDSPIEALADSWASIDGKKAAFRAGKGCPPDAEPGGHYGGYMEEAREMRKRLRDRGFDLWRIVE